MAAPLGTVAPTIARDHETSQRGRGSYDIHFATQDLLEFLVPACHLKDALVADRAVTKSTVEKAITATPCSRCSLIWRTSISTGSSRRTHEVAKHP